MKASRILCSWREPFALAPKTCWRRPGLTLADYARGFSPALPAEFMVHGTICINGHPIARAFWDHVRPKRPRRGRPIELTFHMAPRGGGRGGGKKIFSLIASIALSFATGFILNGGLAAKFGMASFTAGSLAAYGAAAGVMVLGSLLIGALVPPPRAQRNTREKFRNEGAASVEGNVLEPNGAIPRVIGTRKIFPPLGAEPLTVFDRADEVVEAVFALAGPHRLQDIRVGSAVADGLAGVEIETREGWPGDRALELIRRHGRTDSVQAQLAAHSVDADDGARLDTTLDPSLAVPQPMVVATRRAPDEHQLQVIFPQGLFTSDGANIRLRVPLRLRMRPRGSDIWRNLPELHFMAANMRQLRATIRLIWTDSPATPSAATGEGWVEARHTCPDQVDAPAGGGWVADAAFGTGSPEWMAAGNLGSTTLEHVELDRYEARILLDPADWPPGMWEVEITRGAVFKDSTWAAAGYQVSSSVWDLFGYRNPSTRAIPLSREGVSDTLMLLRAVSIWNSPAVIAGDLALIAVRARNRPLEKLSTLAGGWVRDHGRAPDVDGGYGAGMVLQSAPVDHRVADAYIEARVTIPATPTGAIWGAGDARNAYLGFTAGDLVFRAGAGGVSPNPDYVARVAVDAGPIKGKTGILIAQVDYGANSVRVQFVDEATGAVLIDQTAPCPLRFPVAGWTSLAGRAAFDEVRTIAGEDNTAFNGILHRGQFWIPMKVGATPPGQHLSPGWVNWTITGNPAPHVRDMLCGRLNADPLPEDALDTAGLLEFRGHCDSMDYRVNAVLEGQSVATSVEIAAACGYARPMASEIWGVAMDRDTSLEAPLQLFTPRNSAGFSWRRTMPKLPDGLRVNFRDADLDYEARQVTVLRPGGSPGGVLEQIDYEGLVTEAGITARARYDLAQPEARGTEYSLTAPAEAIVCRRGSLVAVSHDSLSRQIGAARVAAVHLDGAGNVDALDLDSRVELVTRAGFDAVPDLGAVEDVGLIGASSAALIRRTDGTLTVHPVAGDGEAEQIAFSPAISATGIADDVLVAVGLRASETLRLKVTAIEPREDFTATLTMIDEANEVFANG